MTVRIKETNHIAACHALRRAVFVTENGICEEIEFDDLDADAIHLLAFSAGSEIASARIVIRGSVARIGHVCVLNTHRGCGIGTKIMRACLHAISIREKIERVELGAVVSAIPFYERLGFTIDGPEYQRSGSGNCPMVMIL